LKGISGLHGTKKVIILDLNFNGTLKDDKIFQFEYLNTDFYKHTHSNFFEMPKPPEETNHNASTRMDNYGGNEEYLRFTICHDSNFYFKYTLVEIQPYFNMVPDDRVFEAKSSFDYWFLIMLAEHRYGYFTWSGSDYEVLIQQGGIRESFNYSKVLIVESDSSRVYEKAFRKNLIYYPVENSIVLDNETFSIEIDPINGDWLKLIKLNKFNFNNEKREKFIHRKSEYLDEIDTTKVYIVHFWGSWCSPCKEDFPSFVSFLTEFNVENVLGVAVEHNTSLPSFDMNYYISEYKLPRIQVIDSLTLRYSKGLAGDNNITIYPSYLIVENGNVLFESRKLNSLKNFWKSYFCNE
jgi:thiol-disulfide isomerase/thioredoxin